MTLNFLYLQCVFLLTEYNVIIPRPCLIFQLWGVTHKGLLILALFNFTCEVTMQSTYWLTGHRNLGDTLFT